MNATDNIFRRDSISRDRLVVQLLSEDEHAFAATFYRGVLGEAEDARKQTDAVLDAALGEERR